MQKARWHVLSDFLAVSLVTQDIPAVPVFTALDFTAVSVLTGRDFPAVFSYWPRDFPVVSVVACWDFPALTFPAWECKKSPSRDQKAGIFQPYL